MFVIITYDVNVKRVSKVMKICRKYLTHEQNSVFEGMITEKKLSNLKGELQKVIKVESDRINIYSFNSLNYSSKETIGWQKPDDNIC